jgi:hypothetical protein
VDRPWLPCSIQNGSSRLLISQVFLPRSVPNRHLQDALRTKCFFRASVPTAMLALADDAALARLAKTSFSTSGKELHQFNVPITRATFTKNGLSACP